MISRITLTKDQKTSIALISSLTLAAVGAFVWLIRNDLPADNPERLVNTFVDIVSEGALKSEGVNWRVTRSLALAGLPKNATEQDVYRAYGVVLNALNDRHTTHLPRDLFSQLIAAPVDKDVSRAFVAAAAELGGIARIEMRGYVSANPKSVVTDGLYALAAVEKVLTPQTCGIIVDLSANTGGNMYPIFGGTHATAWSWNTDAARRSAWQRV